MNTNKIIIAIIYLWIGFVCAISFMEAWLKFRAKGVTQPIGLAIGRLVFSALNKVEIVFAILLIIASYFLMKQKIGIRYLQIMIIPMAILAVQTLCILPILDERVQLIMQNKTLPPSYIHLVYVILEILKVGTLFFAGSKVLKNLS